MAHSKGKAKKSVISMIFLIINLAQIMRFKQYIKWGQISQMTLGGEGSTTAVIFCQCRLTPLFAHLCSVVLWQPKLTTQAWPATDSNTVNLMSKWHYSAESTHLLVWTRQHSYRKEERAMRPIYGCPEKFRESSQTPRLLFPKFVKGFCSDRY